MHGTTTPKLTKVKLALTLAMKALRRTNFSLPRRLKVVGKRHAPAALEAGKRPGTNCTRDWVRPRARLTDVEYLASNGIRSLDPGGPTYSSKPLELQQTARRCQSRPLPQGAKPSQVPHYANTGVTLCQHPRNEWINKEPS
jgi:hypothetical protein